MIKGNSLFHNTFSKNSLYMHSEDIQVVLQVLQLINYSMDSKMPDSSAGILPTVQGTLKENPSLGFGEITALIRRKEKKTTLLNFLKSHTLYLPHPLLGQADG